MPSYKIHLVGGAATYGLITVTIPLITSMHLQWHHHILMLGIALMGSIFPDIDIASRIQIMFFRIMFIVLPLLLFFNYLLTFVCMAMISLGLVLIKHRTLTHRTWFLFVLSIICALSVSIKHPALTELACMAGLYFFIGSISHLVLDYGVNKWKLRKY